MAWRWALIAGLAAALVATLVTVTGVLVWRRRATLEPEPLDFDLPAEEE